MTTIDHYAHSFANALEGETYQLIRPLSFAINTSGWRSKKCSFAASSLYFTRIMKVFLLILALTTLALADDHHGHHHGAEHTADYVVKTEEDLLKARTQCVSEVGVSAEDIEKYKRREFPDEEKTRCYLKCMFEKFGLFDEEHGFDVHKLHVQIEDNANVDHSDETHQKIANCVDNNSQGSDACTRAYRGVTCFVRSNLHLVKPKA